MSDRERIERLESELQQERDIRSDRESTLQLIAESIGLSSEPHQTFFERMLERIDALTAPPTVPEAEKSAIEATLRFVDERIAPLKCDNEAVSACWRCQTIYLASVVRRAIAQHSEPGRESDKCVWSDNGDFWEASCGGVAWYFDTGGTPQDHGMQYCFSCGRPLAPAPDADEKDNG